MKRYLPSSASRLAPFESIFLICRLDASILENVLSQHGQVTRCSEVPQRLICRRLFPLSLMIA